MNILILNWRDPKNPKSGGAEYVTLQHAKFWLRKGCKVTWFSEAFAGGLNSELIEGIEIIRKSRVPWLFFHAAIFYFYSGRKWDIVIDQIHGLPFFTPLYVRSPIVAYIHEIAGEIWSYMYPFPIYVLGGILERGYFLLYKRVRFMVPSESTSHDLLKMGIAKKNIQIVYGCVPRDASLLDLKKEQDPTFIFISRLVRMKGVERVLESFRYIHETLPSAKLWVLGEGDDAYKEVLRKKARDLNLIRHVTFFGYVTEKKRNELLRQAHILLHASVKEGWGLVVLEAAMQETPSIVYDVAGLRDVVMDGKTGIVLKQNTPEQMAQEAIQLFFDAKRYRVLQKSCIEWASSFEWEKECDKSFRFLLDSIKTSGYR